MTDETTTIAYQLGGTMSLFGFLNCEKAVGMTSRDAVNVVQRRIRPVKVGHAGTLDPLAEGVLVLGVGPAVRLVPYVQQQAKHYVATFRLGQSSVSGDLEGDVETHTGLPIPTAAQLASAASDLTGDIEQVPPAHSAIWVGGQRAYKRVRAGEQVEMPTRKVSIHALSVTRYEFPEVDLDIVCGSGTYIRTLGIDLAKKVGSISVMTHLKRVAVGEFRSSESVTIEQLREQSIESLLMPAILAVGQLGKIVVDDQQSIRLGHGLCIDGDVDEPGSGGDFTQIAAVTSGQRLRAICRRKNDAWYPYRVFPVD